VKKARVNGIDLEYEVQGSGEPVLLIPPGPIADSFRPLYAQEALASSYQLIRYHQRGQGGSTGTATPGTFADHAEDAAALIGHLGLRRAHVAGHSTGANTALQLGLDHPELVHTLVLLEPPLMSVPAAAEFFEKIGPSLAEFGAGRPAVAIAEFISAVCSLDWPHCQQLIEQHTPGGEAQVLKDATNFFGAILPALSAWQFGPDQAKKISQPVLSVVGTESDPLFKQGHTLLCSWFPQLEECVVVGTAHLLHLQDPRRVSAGISEFLARNSMS
jgi:pimeloyl-ACP methyl ester carboxylesterase